jgi:hypothetical protein
MHAYDLPTFSFNFPHAAVTRGSTFGNLRKSSSSSSNTSHLDIEATSTHIAPPLPHYFSNSSGLPYIIGANSPQDGKAESVDPIVLNEQYANERIFMLSVHYQGGGKFQLNKDACRNLLTTAALGRNISRVGYIRDPHVKWACLEPTKAASGSHHTTAAGDLKHDRLMAHKHTSIHL